MPKPTGERPGRPHLERDGQQWLFDYMVQETGRVFHWWGDHPRDLPKSVRSHAMIPKHLGRNAARIERLAKAEAAAGHRHTALELYYQAAMGFMQAQHPIFELNDEKRFLYAGLRRTYDEARKLAPYTIERIDVPWEGTTVSGWLHLAPGAKKAPLLFYLTGCDATCEMWPNPSHNAGHERGMHVFSFDGPGQGQSNMRGIKLTGDNYARAASAALDVLVKRPEIDADKVAMFGIGGGSLWGMRWAAEEPRLKAVATSSTYTDLYYLMNEDGPRWKQLFAFLTQSTSEAELEKVMDELGLDGHMAKITAPTLMLSGEYDLRDPIDEAYEIFDQITAPAELWVFADQFHLVSFGVGGSSIVHLAMVDWLKDRLDGKPVAHPGEVLYLEPGNDGPSSPSVTRKRKWYEAAAGS